MDTIDVWKRVLIGAIAAVLVAVAIGGVYLLYAWSKLGSGPVQDDAPPTPTEQQRRALDPFTAPYSATAKDPTTANVPSPETPSEFDAPVQSSGAGAQSSQTAPDTPSSFDAPN